MTRKAHIHSSVLGNEPVEILGHNPNRIKATIYPDTYNGSGTFAFGSSSQQATDSPTVYLYYLQFVWEGINSLWAALPNGVSADQGYTIVELVDE